MKKIIVPTDFSENAYAALLYTCKLYAYEEVQFTILHSFEAEMSQLTSRVDIGRSDEVLQKLMKSTTKEGERLLEKLKSDKIPTNHHYKFVATPYMLSREINEMIKNEGVSLVAMGSKGRTGLEEVLMGSTTEYITQTIQGCPLLIVPNDVNFVIPRFIAFATDFNDFMPVSGIKAMTRLVRHFGSEIIIVHVGEETDLNKKQLENYENYRNDLSEYDSQFVFVKKEKSVSNTLHRLIDEKNIDLIALIFHKHAFIKKLFREPVVTRVGQHRNVPTLVIPAAVTS